MYYVYVHTVPNGKIYIGQTLNADKRWSDGENYKRNKEFYNDIEIYGWDNIKHEIICEVETRTEAETLEKAFIIITQSEKEHIGYNKTQHFQSLNNMFLNKKDYLKQAPNYESEERNIFTKYNKPRSVGLELINEWIFNELYRKIAIRRLLDGIDFPALSKEFGISERQLKRIVYRCEEIIEQKL